MATDLKLDEFMDIDLSTGDLQFISAGEETAQYCAIQLLKIQGEDPFNPGLGLPWFDGLLSIYDSVKTKLLYLRKAVLRIPEITKINKMEMGVDRDNNAASVDWSADSIYGAINEVGSPD